jgi:hypothetical protein
MLHSPGGTALGVQVSLDAAEPDRIVKVAEQVREWAIEQLWGPGRQRITSPGRELDRAAESEGDDRSAFVVGGIGELPRVG